MFQIHARNTRDEKLSVQLPIFKIKNKETKKKREKRNLLRK